MCERVKPLDNFIYWLISVCNFIFSFLNFIEYSILVCIFRVTIDFLGNFNLDCFLNFILQSAEFFNALLHTHGISN